MGYYSTAVLTHTRGIRSRLTLQAYWPCTTHSHCELKCTYITRQRSVFSSAWSHQNNCYNSVENKCLPPKLHSQWRHQYFLSDKICVADPIQMDQSHCPRSKWSNLFSRIDPIVLSHRTADSCEVLSALTWISQLFTFSNDHFPRPNYTLKNSRHQIIGW